MPWRRPSEDIAKVGVEGSNPFARSRLRSAQKPRKAVAFCIIGEIRNELIESASDRPRLPLGY